MHLGTYSVPGEIRWRAALFLDDDRLLDLAAAARQSRAEGARLAAVAPDETDIVAWITPAGQAAARQLLAAARAGRLDPQVHKLADMVHGPPMPRPAKFIAVGRNYMNHVQEGQKLWAARGVKVELPTFPAAFIKFASGIVAHKMPIALPQDVENVDYEIELALVIGKPAYRVAQASALDYVAGYTICNDIGARKLQRQEMEAQIGLTLSKNFRSFAPTGPWLVTSDEIPDPQGLDIRLTVNGEERQRANTSDMIFPVAQLVSYWSQIGLEPGDMITTGTPSGVALARPQPELFYLKPGDVVKASIERIGCLENPVVLEKMASTSA